MKLIYLILIFSTFLGVSVNAMEEKPKSVESILSYLHYFAYRPTKLQELKDALKAEPEANLDIPQTPHKDYPLIMAVHANDPKEVRILLNHGANPNIKDIYRGDTPLMRAIENLFGKDIHNVRRLLKYRPKYNQVEYERKYTDAVKIVKALLANPKTDIFATNNKGLTALEILKQKFEEKQSLSEKLENQINDVTDVISKAKEMGTLIVDVLVKNKEMEKTKKTLREHLIEKGIPVELIDQYIFEFAK